jgi:N-alpha-acetyl-L-2,4-diaminobutyrate deacetylase
VLVPVAVLRNGDGPRVWLNAGSHGGEHEGPVALLKLLHALEPEDITGTLIVTPALNLPAVEAGTRLSPIDHRDLNRVFPGDPGGTVSQVLAHYVSEELLPMCDVVIDLHSGGASLELLPYASMHRVPDPDQFAATFAAMRAFSAPYGLVIEEISGPGLLDYEAERTGKVFLCPELGSGGRLGANTLSIAETGVRNVLAHVGMLPHAPVPDSGGGGDDMVLLDVSGPESYYPAPERGVYETLVELGDRVGAGDPVGRLHPLDLMRDPQTIRARHDGVALGRRSPGIAERGDCLAVLARPYVQHA